MIVNAVESWWIMLKQVYRRYIRWLESLAEKAEGRKTWLAEWYAIYRKAPLYRHIKWSREQQEEFDQFWIQVYGKKISSRWHKLYQSLNGIYQVDYIPEMLYTTKIEPVFNDRAYALVMEDKSLVELFCANEAVVVPQTVCLRSAGCLYDADRHPISKENAAELLRGAGRVVVKPTVGSSSGKGLQFFELSNDIPLAKLNTIVEGIGRDAIVQKCIVPHASFAVFNNTSINTIRITTYIINGEIRHAPLAFRIGRKDKYVDNIHAGGIGVGVHDDGTLLRLGYELGYGDNGKTYERHPDSGVTFAGAQLLYIPQIIDVAYRIHGKIPHIGIISWDFTVNAEEEIVLIELNMKGQGAWFPQIIHGQGLFGENTATILRKVRC